MAQDDVKSIDQLNEEADIAADYLEGLLDIADYEGDIEMGVRNDRPTVQIVADDDTDIKHLIGRNGEVVDALQQLTRLAVQQKTGEHSHYDDRASPCPPQPESQGSGMRTPATMCGRGCTRCWSASRPARRTAWRHRRRCTSPGRATA